MMKKRIKIIGLSVTVGVFLSIISVLYFNRLPQVPLSEKYLQVQAGLFYALIGSTTPYIIENETGEMRVLSIFFTTTGLSTLVVLIIFNNSIPLQFIGVIILLSFIIGVEMMARRNIYQKHLIDVLVLVLAALVVFFVLFLLFSIIVSGNAGFSLPLLLSIGLFYISTGVLKNEREALL